MVAGEDFLLKWNDHHALFFAGAEELVTAEEYTDVTLAAGTRFFAAHRLVLSICSPYFRLLFKRLGGEKTVIFLKDVEPKHLELLLEYMYKGEIKVEETELVNVLNTAQSLEIRGLTDSGQKSDTQAKSKSSSSSTGVGKRPAAASSPASNIASSNHHHHLESQSNAAAAPPPRKRTKAVSSTPTVVPSVPGLHVTPSSSSSLQQSLVKVKAEEVDLHDVDDDTDNAAANDVIQMGSTDNNWNVVGSGGGIGPGGSRGGAGITDPASGGSGSGSEAALLAVGAGGGVGGSDYDEDYGGGDASGAGTVATGYEEMGYEGDDYYSEEGMMQIGEGDDREKEKTCVLCRKEFSTPYNLRVHVRTVHENLKLHRCTNCSRTFSQSSSLYRHIRTAHSASSLGYEAPVGDV